MPREKDIGAIVILIGGVLSTRCNSAVTPNPLALGEQTSTPISLIRPTDSFQTLPPTPIRTPTPVPPIPSPTHLPTTILTRSPTLIKPTLIAPTATRELTTPTPESQTLSRFLLQGLIYEDQKLSDRQRQLNPAEYDQRIDQELNTGRVNIVIWGSGISHEPPFDKLRIASPLIISFDYIHNSIDLVSITHDVWIPFIDRVLGTFGQPNSANRLDQAILNKDAAAKYGGKFLLSQRVIEDVTGLKANFQIHLDDQVIKDFVDQVTDGSLLVEVPVEMHLDTYYMDDGPHYREGWNIKPGLVKLSADDVVGYIKDIPTVSPGQKDADGHLLYDPQMEHSARRTAVVKSFLNYTKEHLLDFRFQIRLANFINSLNNPDKFSTNFDMKTLFLNLLWGFAGNSATARYTNFDLPSINHSPYAVDPCCTADPDTPLRWSEVLIRDGNQAVRLARDKGVLKPGQSYEVPLGADPNNPDSLVWCESVRVWLKNRLLH